MKLDMPTCCRTEHLPNLLRIAPCNSTCRTQAGTALLKADFFYTHPGPMRLTLGQSRVFRVELQIPVAGNHAADPGWWVGAPMWFHVLMRALITHAQPSEHLGLVEAVNARPELQQAIMAMHMMEDHEPVLEIWKLVIAGVRR